MHIPPLVVLQPLALLHQKKPYCWRRHYVAYSLTLAILKISWARLAFSMKLAPTNVFVQSSRRFEKSGNNVKRKKSSSERLKKIGSVQPTEVVNLRPTPTRLAGRTTHLGQAVLSCLRLDMPQPGIRVLLLAIQAEWTRCIRPRVMVRFIQDTLTPPMAKASKCMCTYPKTYIFFAPILYINAIIEIDTRTPMLRHRHACTRFLFLDGPRVRYPKRLVEKHIWWEWRK